MRVVLVAVLAFVGCGTPGGAGDRADGAPGPEPDAAPVIDAPPPLVPDDPGAADVRVTIDSARDVRAISPFIYGTNAPDWGRDAALYTLTRSGGNRLTAYNWENNASNAGTDYMNQNDGFLGASDAPGKAQTDPIADAHAHGA